MGDKKYKGVAKHKQEVLTPKEIDEQTRIRNNHSKQLSIERQEFSGPLPPPEILKGYETILPGAAERILSMAENQANHRQIMEQKFLNANTRNSFIGLIFAFLIALAITIGGIICILNNKGFSGTFLGASGLLGVLGVFVYGTRLTTGNNKISTTGESHKKEKVEGEVIAE